MLNWKHTDVVESGREEFIREAEIDPLESQRSWPRRLNPEALRWMRRPLLVAAVHITAFALALR